MYSLYCFYDAWFYGGKCFFSLSSSFSPSVSNSQVTRQVRGKGIYAVSLATRESQTVIGECRSRCRGGEWQWSLQMTHNPVYMLHPHWISIGGGSHRTLIKLFFYSNSLLIVTNSTLLLILYLNLPLHCIQTLDTCIHVYRNFDHSLHD